MTWLSGIAGALLIAAVLWDAFETIVMPRRASGRIYLTRSFYRATWIPFRTFAGRIRNGRRREGTLSLFGPMSLVLLLVTWAGGLVVGFGLLQFANGSSVHLGSERPGLALDLYLSGASFFTLGLGDALPIGTLARVLSVVESGVGLGFLAIMIGYFPVLYQAFSRREYGISLLDARAGSPPTAMELLRRHTGPGGQDALQNLLYDWEQWSAELLETHLSYPLLAYYRSQHRNQSWLAALTTILDTCALVMTGVEGACVRQARLTFAMARHAVADLAQLFPAPSSSEAPDRLGEAAFQRLRSALAEIELPLPAGPEANERLAELRRGYEPHVLSLSRYLLQPLPPWFPTASTRDNWEFLAGDGSGKVPAHF